MPAVALQTCPAPVTSAITSQPLTAVSILPPPTESPVNEAQAEVLLRYECGRYAHLLHEHDAKALHDEAAKCRDPLLSFLLQECSNAAGCQDVKTALHKIDAMSSKLDSLYGELESAEISRSLVTLRHRFG